MANAALEFEAQAAAASSAAKKGLCIPCSYSKSCPRGIAAGRAGAGSQGRDAGVGAVERQLQAPQALARSLTVGVV